MFGLCILIWGHNLGWQWLCVSFCSGPPTPSSTQRGCWPTSWGSSSCVLGGSWATWSPRRSTDVLQTPRKSLCPSTSRLWLKASPPARPDRPGMQELKRSLPSFSEPRFKMFSKARRVASQWEESTSFSSVVMTSTWRGHKSRQRLQTSSQMSSIQTCACVNL